MPPRREGGGCWAERKRSPSSKGSHTQNPFATRLLCGELHNLLLQCPI